MASVRAYHVNEDRERENTDRAREKKCEISLVNVSGNRCHPDVGKSKRTCRDVAEINAGFVCFEPFYYNASVVSCICGCMRSCNEAAQQCCRFGFVVNCRF